MVIACLTPRAKVMRSCISFSHVSASRLQPVISLMHSRFLRPHGPPGCHKSLKCLAVHVDAGTWIAQVTYQAAFVKVTVKAVETSMHAIEEHALASMCSSDDEELAHGHRCPQQRCPPLCARRSRQTGTSCALRGAVRPASGTAPGRPVLLGFVCTALALWSSMGQYDIVDAAVPRSGDTLLQAWTRPVRCPVLQECLLACLRSALSVYLCINHSSWSSLRAAGAQVSHEPRQDAGGAAEEAEVGGLCAREERA